MNKPLKLLIAESDDVAATARLLEELNDEPSRPDLLWRLGTVG